MFNAIKVFIEFASALILIFSAKADINIWLAIPFATALLLIGAYYTAKKSPRALVQIASGILILLPALNIQTQAFLSIPVGIAMFAIALSGLLPILYS